MWCEWFSKSFLEILYLYCWYSQINFISKGCIGIAFFLGFFIFCLCGTTKTYSETNSSRCMMKALKVDENRFKWMKLVQMDEFLVTRMFILAPFFAKNRSEGKKIPSSKILLVKKSLIRGTRPCGLSLAIEYCFYNHFYLLIGMAIRYLHVSSYIYRQHYLDNVFVYIYVYF